MQVIWDPEGKVLPGTVFDRESKARAIEALASRGVAMIPTRAEKMAINPIAGAFVTHWGDGWDFDGVAAQRGCPMLNFVTPDTQSVTWRARLAPNGKGGKPSGILRLVPSTAVMGAISGGLSADGMPVDVAKLEAPDQWGGWTVGGVARCSPTIQGYFASNLYGYLSGVRVLWSAVSFV